jgi:hypothetical protein
VASVVFVERVDRRAEDHRIGIGIARSRTSQDDRVRRVLRDETCVGVRPDHMVLNEIRIHQGANESRGKPRRVGGDEGKLVGDPLEAVPIRGRAFETRAVGENPSDVVATSAAEKVDSKRVLLRTREDASVLERSRTRRRRRRLIARCAALEGNEHRRDEHRADRRSHKNRRAHTHAFCTADEVHLEKPRGRAW